MNSKQKMLITAGLLVAGGLGVMPWHRLIGIAVAAGGVFLALRAIDPPRK